MKFTNETTVDRITLYVQQEEYEKAKALAILADHLEECYLWDVSFVQD